MIGAPSVQRVQYRALTQCELALSAESGVNNDLVQVNHTNFLPALRIYPGNCSSIKLQRSRVSVPNSWYHWTGVAVCDSEGILHVIEPLHWVLMAGIWIDVNDLLLSLPDVSLPTEQWPYLLQTTKGKQLSKQYIYINCKSYPSW